MRSSNYVGVCVFAQIGCVSHDSWTEDDIIQGGIFIFKKIKSSTAPPCGIRDTLQHSYTAHDTGPIISAGGSIHILKYSIKQNSCF